MTRSIHVSIVGAGAVGCWVGALLGMSGVRVTLVGRRAAVDVIERDGITLLRGDRQDVVHCDATTEHSRIADADIVLLCVKSADTESAAEALASHVEDHHAIVSLQNGVDNAERASDVLRHAVYATAVYVGAEIEQAGVVRHLGRGDLVLGRHAVGTGAAGDGTVERIAQCFADAGIPCALTDDITATLWQKLVINAAYNPISAITELPYGLLLQDDAMRAQMHGLAAETIAVGQALGVPLDGPALLGSLWQIGEAMPKQFSSTAQDLRHGRRTEIDALNGHVSDVGHRLGIPTPLNDEVTRVIRQLEQLAVD